MSFRVGQKVRVIRGSVDDFGPSACLCVGKVTTIRSALIAVDYDVSSDMQAGTLLHILDLTSPDGCLIACPPSWLEPADDGRDAIEWSEELRRLCGLDVEERT